MTVASSRGVEEEAEMLDMILISSYTKRES